MDLVLQSVLSNHRQGAFVVCPYDDVLRVARQSFSTTSPLCQCFLEQTLLVELISFPRHHLPPSPGAVADDRLHTAASDAVIGHGLLGALHWTERRVIF